MSQDASSGTRGPVATPVQRKPFDDGAVMSWWCCPDCGRIAGTIEPPPWLCSCGLWLRADEEDGHADVV